MASEMEKRIDQLVGKLIDDYQEGKVIDKIKNFEHPNREKVVDILETAENHISGVLQKQHL